VARSTSFFGPSETALEFGEQYAAVLARWADMFNAASSLVAANVELGRMAADSGKEFDRWLRQTANAPWGWLDPQAMQRMMQAFMPPPPPGS
jgi:hypothetical protein